MAVADSSGVPFPERFERWLAEDPARLARVEARIRKALGAGPARAPERERRRTPIAVTGGCVCGACELLHPESPAGSGEGDAAAEHPDGDGDEDDDDDSDGPQLLDLPEFVW
jgi:hypothetical protein